MICIKVCSKCKSILLTNVCSKCLANAEEIEVDENMLEALLIEGSYSYITNSRFGLIEVRFNDSKVRVFGKIYGTPNHNKLRIRKFDGEFEFDAI